MFLVVVFWEYLHLHEYENDLNTVLSLRLKLWTKCCFMKQKCQIQKGVEKYKNEAMPLSNRDINATNLHYQIRFDLAQGVKKLAPIEV